MREYIVKEGILMERNKDSFIEYISNMSKEDIYNIIENKGKPVKLLNIIILDEDKY